MKRNDTALLSKMAYIRELRVGRETRWLRMRRHFDGLPIRHRASNLSALERLTNPNCRVEAGLARPLVPDALWAVIEPLLPPACPKPKGGRAPIPDRAALAGILFVLKCGIPWELLPAEMGCGAGMSC